jgi:hypothetical protein
VNASRILFILAACCAPGPAGADEAALQPGLYEVTFTLELPNVVTTGIGPSTVRRCIAGADMRTGTAFGVLGDNPIRACPLKDYSLSGNRALYRIECPGPNAPFATGAFDLTMSSYRGVITMNMGGKNMTMSERQRGRRIGVCP